MRDMTEGEGQRDRESDRGQGLRDTTEGQGQWDRESDRGQGQRDKDRGTRTEGQG